MVLDIYSRYVMGWMLASRELGELAERLLADSIRKQGVDRNQLTTTLIAAPRWPPSRWPSCSPTWA